MVAKANQIKQASKTAKSVKKGVLKKKYTIRSKLRFFRPRTLKLASQPKYARNKAVLKMPAKFDKFSVLTHPLNTEKANKAMTERNTLVFLVHSKANKCQIKKTFNEIYHIKPKSINTLIKPDGKKKAYIRLRPEDDAVGVASKMGII